MTDGVLQLILHVQRAAEYASGKARDLLQVYGAYNYYAMQARRQGTLTRWGGLCGGNPV